MENQEKKKFPRGLKTAHNKRCESCGWNQMRQSVKRPNLVYGFCNNYGEPGFVIIERELTENLGWQCPSWQEAGHIGENTERSYTGKISFYPWASGKGGFVNVESIEEEFVIFADAIGYNDLAFDSYASDTVVIQWSEKKWNDKYVIVGFRFANDDDLAKMSEKVEA